MPVQNRDDNWMRQLAKSGSAPTRGATSAEAVDCDALDADRRYTSLKDRLDRISHLIGETRTRIQELQEKLNEGRHHPSVRKKLRYELEDQHALLKDAVYEQVTYGKLAKAAAVDSFGATFLEVARIKLDGPTFQALFNETRTMLGRRPGAGIVVPTIPQTQAQPDRKRRGRRMHPDEVEAMRAGRIRASGGNLVWSDERDREVEADPSMRP